MENKYISVLDLGTSKISLAIALVEDCGCSILFFKRLPSAGIRRGNIFNIQLAAKVVSELIETASDTLKIKIESMYVNFPQSDIFQKSKSAKFERPDPGQEISEEEIAGTTDFAKEEFAEDEQNQIYDAIIQYFSCDNHINLNKTEIIGMMGRDFQTELCFFMGKKAPVVLTDKLFEKLNILKAEMIFSPMGLSDNINKNDLEHGVALVDFGGGKTSVSIFEKGILRYHNSIPFGGEVITKDIEKELQISFNIAEKIKMTYGACIPDKLGTLGGKIIRVRSGSEIISEFKTDRLSQIIDARVREIINAVLYCIMDSKYHKQLKSGIIITGGSANLINLCQLINNMSGYRTRLCKISESVNFPDPDMHIEQGDLSTLGMISHIASKPCFNCAYSEDTSLVSSDCTSEVIFEVQDCMEHPASGKNFQENTSGNVAENFSGNTGTENNFAGRFENRQEDSASNNSGRGEESEDNTRNEKGKNAGTEKKKPAFFNIFKGWHENSLKDE